MSKKTILLLVLIVSVTTFRLVLVDSDAVGFPYGECNSSYIDVIKLRAEQGDAEAELNLGNLYSSCEIGKSDEAVKWYRRAAEQGNARAQFLLGVLAKAGNGVPEDDREAMKWYKLAAEQGDVHAQTSLGNMYADGEGVPEDDREAVKWYRLAAEQGLGAAPAQFYLGLGR